MFFKKYLRQRRPKTASDTIRQLVSAGKESYAKHATENELEEPEENLYKTFRIINSTLSVIGRFPYFSKKQEDGTYEFRYSLFSSFRGLYFLIMSLYFTAIITLNFAGILLLMSDLKRIRRENAQNKTTSAEYEVTSINTVTWDSNTTKSSVEEIPLILDDGYLNKTINGTAMDPNIQFLMENVFQFVIVSSVCFNASATGLTNLFSGGKMAKHFTLWSKSLKKTKIDAARGLRKKVFKQAVGFLILMTLLFMGTVVLRRPKFLADAVDASGLLPMRLFGIHMAHPSYNGLMTMAGTTLILGYWSYKMNIILYEFICALLQNSFKIWNDRLENVIKNMDNGEDTRNSYVELYKDHCTLVDLVQSANTTFKPIILTYYSSQIMVLCFECFWIARNFNSPEVARVITGFIIFVQTGGLLYMVSLKASYVYEEAHRGYEIVRSKGFVHASCPQERLLLESLTTSFMETIQMTGGHYFGISRAFIQDVSGAVLTYFVIIIQFNPDNM